MNWLPAKNRHLVMGSPRLVVMTTAEDAGAGCRRLACGCQQRFVEGNIVTEQFSDWITTIACPLHNTQESAFSAPSSSPKEVRDA